MIIVTGPYSSTNKEIKELRIKSISDACLNLMHRGDISVSPLILGLALIEKSGKDLPDSYEFWSKFCKEFVSKSDIMYILNLEGWESSNGVKDEIQEAHRLNIPVYLVDSKTLQHIKHIK